MFVIVILTVLNYITQGTSGAVLSLTNNSMFLGKNSLFKDNTGGDLLANDSHFRIDKSLFTGERG